MNINLQCEHNKYSNVRILEISFSHAGGLQFNRIGLGVKRITHLKKKLIRVNCKNHP